MAKRLNEFNVQAGDKFYLSHDSNIRKTVTRITKESVFTRLVIMGIESHNERQESWSRFNEDIKSELLLKTN